MATKTVVASLIWLCAFSASAQTVEEIVAKHVEALGGRENLEAIHSLKLTGTLSRGPFETRFTLYFKRPNLVRNEIEMRGQTMVQAYDGQAAWGILPFRSETTPRTLPERMAQGLIERADFAGPLVNYRARGHQVMLIGKEDFEGTEVYKLQITTKGGRTLFSYLDAEHFIEIKRVTRGTAPDGTEFEVTTLFSDYKPVNGVMLAHVIETQGGGFGGRGRRAGRGGGRAIQTIEHVEVNPELAEVLFQMPKAEK